MFGKGTGNIETLVSRECEIKGNVRCKGAVRVDGRAEGNITSSSGVIIGNNAVIKGDIEARHIVIGGRVTGDVIAHNKLEILSSGKLYGDIRTPKLSISEGVVFEGTCEMEKAIQETSGKK